MPKEKQSITQRLGGNRTVVLVVVVILLLCFTVASEVIPALGITGDREFARFTVGGRPVTLTNSEFAARYHDWQRFNARIRRVGREDFLQDLMLGALAEEAGVRVPDGSLRAWVEALPPFQDVDGNFDRELFDQALREHFAGVTPRVFESEARRLLRVSQYRDLFLHSFALVSDGEAYARWKGDHPKVRVRYAWQPVALVRAEMDPAAITQEALDLHWANPRVQGRFQTPPRRSFDALWIACDEFPDDAFRALREKFKHDAAVTPSEQEILEYWQQRRVYDFNIQTQSPESRAALLARNPVPPPPPREDGEPDPAPPQDGEPNLDNPEVVFARFFRIVVEKELWLRKYMQRLLREAADGKVALEDVLRRHAEDGVPVRYHRQDAMVDQYEIEKLPDIGYPNCSLRWALNDYGPEKVGTVHPDVLERSPLSERLETRGWLVVRVLGVDPSHVPPLADVRDKVVDDLLDQRAKDEARARLEALRSAAQEATDGGLDAAAKAAGFELAEAGPFNEYSWRPPLPRPEPGREAPSPADQWKDKDRRLSSVMGRYFAYREIPPGEYAPVIDDVLSTGAFYLVQVTERAEPPFEEMTAAQKKDAVRAVQQDRTRRVSRELSYDRLKDRLGLTLEGKPAPAAPPEERASR